MLVKLSYGKTGLEIRVPDHADVIEPKFVPGPEDQLAVVREALQNPIGAEPLGSLVRPHHKVGIVFSDITRATPYNVLLPAILSEISHLPPENITLYNATGTHRLNTDDELEQILGPGIVDRYRIVQNDCDDDAGHLHIGTTSGGNEIEILSDFLACDVKILTGFIEPHFFAGFSGGGKAIMPGLATLGTIQRNHNAAHMDHPAARWGVTFGNPLWEEVREAAGFVDGTFLLNVSLNRDQEVTAAFAGHYVEAHAAGCVHVKQHAMAPVDALYDVVVTSNSGYPLDLNMYQSVKGMSAALQIVKPGGHIIIAADCWDGIPSHGKYGQLLAEASSLDGLLERIRAPGFFMQDQWQAQIHALICKASTVHFYSDNLTDQQIEDSFMQPCRDIDATVHALAGDGARVCVLPEGPQTIPYVRRAAS